MEENTDCRMETPFDSSNQSFEMTEFEAEAVYERDNDTFQHPVASKLELWSWYIFDFAAQPFSSASVTFLIPLILEDLAWRAGTSDYNNPSFPPCADRTTLPKGAPPPPCFVRFGAGWAEPVSFALYVISISVGIQVITFITFGAFADYSRWRKLFLVGFSLFLVLVCMLFLTVVSPSLYPLAATLAILGNVAFGTIMVFYNAYLPLLVEAHPTVRDFKHKGELELRRRSGSFSAITATPNPADGSDSGDDEFVKEKDQFRHELQELVDKTTNTVSTHGLASSYVGAVLSLLLLYGLLYAIGDQTYNLQVCVAITGIWLLIGLVSFTVPFLKTRPGPPLPKDEHSYLLFSWKKTFKTFLKARQLKNVFLFLVAWFFYSDAFSTIGQTAILYGKSQLDMSNIQVMIITIEAPFAAILGNYFFLWLFKHQLKLSTKVCTIILLLLCTLIPIWGIVGFAFPESSKIGVRTVTEMYILGAYYGFLIGAVQSFSRSLFSDLVPPGMESEFFSLFEITDRGSSWLGPLLVGVFIQSFGARYAFIAILILFVVSFPFLLLINVQQGRKEAREFSLS